MALDAVFLRAVADELRPEVEGARIEKIRQPARDQIVLVLRGGRRLLLSAGTEAPRMQFTDLARENPAAPPMFCMLLRKHLLGGRVAALTQPPMERLLRLDIDVTDDFGRAGRRSLILEAMGRRANIVLLDGDGRILDALRRLDADTPAQRQILPGLFYRLPDAPARIAFTEETPEGFRAKLAAAPPELTAERFLLREYFGLSPLLAREIAFRASGDADARLYTLDGARLCEAFTSFAEDVRAGRFTPVCLLRAGTPFAFSCVPVLQYGPAAEAVRYPTFSALLDAFFAAREAEERKRLRGAELLRAVQTARSRLSRKLAAQERDYAATLERDTLRIQGDLITANLHTLERGARALVCENFYNPEGGEITIPLDPLLTPQENAARYYRRYTKAKTAERVLSEQMELARRDLAYLDSVLDELDRCETEREFLEVRQELRESGFLRTPRAERDAGKPPTGGPGRPAGKRPGIRKNAPRSTREAKAAFHPKELRLSTGHRVLVGRNNRENDTLTKTANRQDLWLHTQKIHGSHVILRVDGTPPGEDAIQEAAAVAAYFSQARESRHVPVDCTPVRNVKKPAGARPGMVVYTSYRTLYVDPGLPDGT